jgi:hypothetical protein
VFIGHAIDRRNGIYLLRRTAKRPRGHYTARPSTRLPIARFRRFTLSSIDENGNSCVRTQQSWNDELGPVEAREGMAMRERDR